MNFIYIKKKLYIYNCVLKHILSITPSLPTQRGPLYTPSNFLISGKPGTGKAPIELLLESIFAFWYASLPCIPPPLWPK